MLKIQKKMFTLIQSSNALNIEHHIKNFSNEGNDLMDKREDLNLKLEK